MHLASLDSVFTLAHAVSAGFSKDQVYSMLDHGEIERVGRGIFIRPDLIQPTFTALAAVSAIHPSATLCLTSALTLHGLSDDIPTASDIALPRGTHRPAGVAHVNWHSFDPTTFSVGREHVDAGGGVRVAVYSAERTIVDAFPSYTCSSSKKSSSIS